MSIETLLEAAKFLELQALQQQRTREENELRERLCLDQDAGKQRAEVASYVQRARANHVASVEGLSPAHRHASTPAPPPPPPAPLPAHSIPITVIPIPVASPNPTPMPTAPADVLSSPPAAHLSPPPIDAHSPPTHHALQQSTFLANQAKAAPASLSQSSATLTLQPYPGSIITASQHALLPQAGPSPAPPSPAAKSNPFDDPQSLDNRKRPGGAGTREVHNKLEKNRRAHLKECFETLKKNIPNVDEKKTSNLSVLRSALRYIQTLKRREKEYEHEMEHLAREKISMQQRMAELKNELSQWMDLLEMDRVLHQTEEPEDDQASTSTASEGEDNINEDVEEKGSSRAGSLPKAPLALLPETRKPQLTPHVSIPPEPSQSPLHPPAPSAQPAPASAPAQPSAAALSPIPAQAPPLQSVAVVAPPNLPPAHAHIVATASLQPSVIAHGAATNITSHASVIQAINHVAPAGTKHVAHVAHIAPSPSGPAQLSHGPQPIGHIAVHPVAHLGQPLTALYPQPVTVAQPAVVSHVTHALSHGHVNGASTPTSPQAAALMAKQASQVVTHHPQLVGQTVLNPVTMVTMPSFPISTLKLA